MTTDESSTRIGSGLDFLRTGLLVGCIICAAVWILSWFNHSFSNAANWAAVLFPVLVLGATLTSLVRSLPLQNVLFVTLAIAIISGIVETIGVKTGIPFGPFTYTDTLGPQIFGLLPWTVPIIWIVIILNSRGVVRLILRPWRKTGKYGLWLIALTCALSLILDLGLEPFATRVNRFWIWQISPSVFSWHGAPWINFVSWTTSTLLILAFTTPWLIHKRQTRSLPPDYHPLILWVLLNLLFTTGNAVHHLWSAVALTTVATLTTTIFALRGTSW